MIALLIVAAGFLYMLGRSDEAHRLLRLAVILVILFSLLDCLVGQFRVWLRASDLGSLASEVGPLATVLGLAGLGAIAWKTRDWRAKRREAARKRSGSPRERALPAAPRGDASP